VYIVLVVAKMKVENLFMLLLVTTRW